MKPYIHKVQYYETDRMGITHHSNYIRWMEEARVDFLEQAGWGYAKMEASGISSPVTAVQCEYRAPTTFGDTVEIEVSVTEFRGIRLEVAYTMKKQDGTLVCEAASSHCFFKVNGHILRMKKEFPDLFELLSGLAGNHENSHAANSDTANESVSKHQQ